MLQLNFDWVTAGYLFGASLYKLRDFLMAGTHDNVVVKRVLPPLSLEKLWTARYVSESLRWCRCFSKTDHVNFIVGSIIFVLVKMTFLLIRLSTHLIALVSAINQVLNYFPWDGHKMFNIFFLKPRVSEIMVVENNNNPGKQFVFVFNSGERQWTRSFSALCFWCWLP